MVEKLFTHMRETKLRATPTPEGDVVALIPKGTEVEVFEERDGYYGIRAYQVDQGQVSGYVFKSLIGPADVTKEEIEAKVVRHLPTCRECGEKSWAYAPFRLGNTGHAYLVTGFLSYVEVKVRVCLTCGAVVPCVDASGIEELKIQQANK